MSINEWLSKERRVLYLSVGVVFLQSMTIITYVILGFPRALPIHFLQLGLLSKLGHLNPRGIETENNSHCLYSF